MLTTDAGFERSLVSHFDSNIAGDYAISACELQFGMKNIEPIPEAGKAAEFIAKAAVTYSFLYRFGYGVDDMPIMYASCDRHKISPNSSVCSKYNLFRRESSNIARKVAIRILLVSGFLVNKLENKNWGRMVIVNRI